MSPRPTVIDQGLSEFLSAVGWREHPALRGLREATDALPEATMRSSTDQVALLAFLIETIGARSVLEIGCFTGYGSLGMALALPADGRLVTLDTDEKWPAIGRRFWREAGVEKRIELKTGLAAESLERLRAEFGPGGFDLAYVDADKKSYPLYYEHAFELVRRGGLIALDNMFWGGAVGDPDDTRKQAVTLRDLTTRLHADQRVAMILLPIADGLLLVRKR
jgi:O-methyltransferase